MLKEEPPPDEGIVQAEVLPETIKRPLTAGEDLLNPETPEEAALTAVLLAHPNRLDHGYIANPYEHLPSRLLSMLPCPFVSLTRLGLNSAAAGVRITTAESGIAKRKTPVPAPVAAATSTRKPQEDKDSAPLTDAVARSFDEAAKVTLESVRASTNKVPAFVYEVIPNAQMAENLYSTASTADKITVAPGAFFLTHPGTSQTCLYTPAKKPPARITLGKGDIFGVPTEMYTLQNSTNQAPKRWMLFAKDDTSLNGSLAEVTGKRIALAKERGADVAGNAMIHLKVEKRRAG